MPADYARTRASARQPARRAYAEAELAAQAVREAASYSIVQVDTALVLSGIETAQKHRISFWDALIVRAAAQAGCDVILSEDLNDGQVVDGVRIENPFD